MAQEWRRERCEKKREMACSFEPKEDSAVDEIIEEHPGEAVKVARVSGNDDNTGIAESEISADDFIAVLQERGAQNCYFQCCRERQIRIQRDSK